MLPRDIATRGFDITAEMVTTTPPRDGWDWMSSRDHGPERVGACVVTRSVRFLVGQATGLALKAHVAWSCTSYFDLKKSARGGG